MTLKELAMIGARARLRELHSEITQIQTLLKNRKNGLTRKYKKRMSPAKRRAIMKNLEKARIARHA